MGGIKLCVQQEDEEAAFDVLEQRPPASIEVEGVDTYEQLTWPAATLWTSRLRP